MSGTSPNYTYYNDLWRYRLSTRVWSQVGTAVARPFIGGAQILPTARAFHHAASIALLPPMFYFLFETSDFFPIVAFDASTFLFFGGESTSGPLNDFWSVDVDSPCPYLYALLHRHFPRFCHRFPPCTPSRIFSCKYPIDGIDGFCTGYEECHSLTDCSSNSSNAFQCFLDCYSDPSACSSKLRSYSCTYSWYVKCWSGICLPDISQCKPFPACQSNERRCDNGDCTPESSPCSPVVCNPGYQLCPGTRA